MFEARNNRQMLHLLDGVCNGKSRSPRVDVANTDHTPAFLLTKQDDQQKILDGTAVLTTPGEVRGEGDKGSHGE